MRRGVGLNFNHLQERIKQFNGVEMNQAQFVNELKDRLAHTDIDAVKRDVLPFIKNPGELEIWSNDYFLQLVDRIKFK